MEHKRLTQEEFDAELSRLSNERDEHDRKCKDAVNSLDLKTAKTELDAMRIAERKTKRLLERWAAQ